MPRANGLTDAQIIFLRTCSTSPLGPEPSRWPRASTLRKWMRRPGFRVAIQGLRDAMRIQADFHLAAAAAGAAQGISRAVIAEDGTIASAETLKSVKEIISSLGGLLRLSHLRQRFPAVMSAPPRRIPLTPQQKQMLDELRQFAECGLPYNDMTLQEVKDWYKMYHEFNKSDETNEESTPSNAPVAMSEGGAG